MSIIRNFTIILIISSMGLQCANSQKWDLTDIENMDNLFSSWLTYGKQIYYKYQLEGDALFCISNGIWRIIRDHIIEQSRTDLQTTTPKVFENSNSDTSEKYNVAAEQPRIKRSPEESSRSEQKKVNRSLLASLLGITGDQFTQNHSRTVARVKKSVDKKWNDEVKMGNLERTILKSLANSNPIVNELLNFLGNIIYLIHSIWAFMRSSVVLTCLSDYTVSRSSEFMYLDV